MMPNPKMEMRSNKTQDIDTVFHLFLKSNNLEKKYLHHAIKFHWENIVGNTVSRHTQDVFLKETTLVIKVSSAPLKHHLLYAKDDILQKVNEYFGNNPVNAIEIW